jgi:hypothetical protein
MSSKWEEARVSILVTGTREEFIGGVDKETCDSK